MASLFSPTTEFKGRTLPVLTVASLVAEHGGIIEWVGKVRVISEALLSLSEHLQEPGHSYGSRLDSTALKAIRLGELHAIEDDASELLAIHLPAKDLVSKKLPREDELAERL